MGANIRPKDLADLARWNADLKVTCRRCGRSAVFGLLPILNRFRAQGWNTSWDMVASRFVCRGTDEAPGCGGKDLKLGMVPKQAPVPPTPPLSRSEVRRMVRDSRR